MMQGWRLVGLLSGLLLAMSAWLLAMHGGDVEGLRLVIRATARTSLVLFILAFTASALAELVPGAITRWQRTNRRYLGVSFAVSHFIHLAVIVALASVDQALFWKLTNITTIVLAGTAYLFIAAMAATSFDRSAAWLGPRNWRLLHLLGGWYIWTSFATAVGKRVSLDSFYWPMAALVVAAAAVRLIAMSRRNRRRTALSACAFPLNSESCGLLPTILGPCGTLPPDMVSGRSTARGDERKNAGGRHRGRSGSCRLRPEGNTQTGPAGSGFRGA